MTDDGGSGTLTFIVSYKTPNVSDFLGSAAWIWSNTSHTFTENLFNEAKTWSGCLHPVFLGLTAGTSRLGSKFSEGQVSL